MRPADVELFCDRIPVVGVDVEAGGTRLQNLGGSGQVGQHLVYAGGGVGEVVDRGCGVAGQHLAIVKVVLIGLVDEGVVLLLHEDGDVLEDVTVVEAIAAAEDILALAKQIVGKSDTRAEVQGIVGSDLADEGQQRCVKGRSRLEFLVCSAGADGVGFDHVEVAVIAHAQVQRQAAGDLPVILEVDAQLLGAVGDVGGRVAGGKDDVVDQPGGAGQRRGNVARCGSQVRRINTEVHQIGRASCRERV